MKSFGCLIAYITKASLPEANGIIEVDKDSRSLQEDHNVIMDIQRTRETFLDKSTKMIKKMGEELDGIARDRTMPFQAVETVNEYNKGARVSGRRHSRGRRRSLAQILDSY